MTEEKPKQGGPKRLHTAEPAEVRHSQVVGTYGPGAMVDFVDAAVVMGGLDFWKYPANKRPQFAERRLYHAVRRSNAGSDLDLDPCWPFCLPPTLEHVGGEGYPSARFRQEQGIQATIFPRYMVCINPACQKLLKPRIDDLRVKGGPRHKCADQSVHSLVPVRFVATCRKGHLDDFNWKRFAHHEQGEGQKCTSDSLSLLSGISNDISELKVRCACGATRALVDAFCFMPELTCRGRQPWLGGGAQEPCGGPTHLLLRNATNAYFPQVISALSVPEAVSPASQAVDQIWESVGEADASSLPEIRRLIPRVARALAPFDDATALAAIHKRRDPRAPQNRPLRAVEYEHFCAVDFIRPGELALPHETFFARRVLAEPCPAQVERVVTATQLREVRTQVGFTRLDPVTPNLQGEYDSPVAAQRLSNDARWLPAVEVRGEGVFIALDEAALAEWEGRPEVIQRGERLRQGHDRWCAQALSGKRKTQFPGVRFYLLHSLSHLLISAIALECGYSASALRERIYCSLPEAASKMAGILISTASPSSEGTLGGLAAQAYRMAEHLREATRLGGMCSNDPVCAVHLPDEIFGDRDLEGAACHSCLFVAESSCERFNQALDRALVVPTVNQPAQLAFFGKPQ